MEDWKNERAEASMREGTDKIMKAAQALFKKEETLFPKKVEEAKRVLDEVGPVNWDSLNDSNLDSPLTEWNEESIEPKSFEVCLGVGLNQFFPEYVKINLAEDGE